MRRTPLKRRTHLRSVPRPVPDEPGRDEWKQKRIGRCTVCGAQGRVVLHHIITEATVRREGGNPWDQANSLVIGGPFTCNCHASHHMAARKIPFELVPDAALDFGIALMGQERSALYYAARYGERKE